MERMRSMEHERDEHRKVLAAILATAEKAGRALSPEETGRGELISAKLGELEAKIALERESIEFDRHHAVPIAGPGDGWDSAREGVGGGKLSYRSLFGNPAPNAHFKKAEDFYTAVSSGRFHPGLMQATMLEGLGSEGGFLVPEDLAAEAFDSAVEESVFLPRCRVFPMTSESKSLAGIEAGGSATYGPYGTWEPAWVAEGGTIPASTPTVRKVVVTARKLGLYISVSNELLADGLSLGEQLGKSIRKALAWALDSAIAQGNGVGKPVGIVTAPCTVSVAAEGGQAAATVTAANIEKMFARLLPGAYAGAAWYINPTVRPQLYRLGLPVGVGGLPYVGTPLLQVTGSELSLLGLPVYSTEKLPALGAVGDIVLANMAYYALGIRKELSIDQSNAPGFQNDLMAFRGIVRANGLPLLDKAYTPKNGNTLSAFVTLAAR